MQRKNRVPGAVIAVGFLAVSLCRAADLTIDIDALKRGPILQESLYGVFYEDINYAGDGGLYAELVQNRSFEYYKLQHGREKRGAVMHPLYAWERVELTGGACEWAVESSAPLNANNTNYVKIVVTEPGAGVGLRNSGYDGIAVVKDETYKFSFYARWEGDGGAPVNVSLRSASDTPLARAEIKGIGTEWQKFEVELRPSASDPKATLLLTTQGKGALCLDMISLFPAKTYKNRANGLRADLAGAIADLKPATFRFPGGCIVHGHGLSNAYRWKDTLGDVAERKPNWNLWGYHQSYGLGYYEYFQFCEDIGAAPLPILPLGISCGFRQPFENTPLDNLQEWIDDALDLVEFANGAVNTKWGGLRAKMGHPAPFNLKYVGLGNEEHHTPEFEARFPYFVRALRDKHPEIVIVGTSGLGPGIPIYNFMDSQKVDLSDEHYYMQPEWFIENEGRFDNFDRAKPPIYVGEYASNGNQLFNAVAEAVFLTGIERNADLVHMTAYAPLLAHYNFTQWGSADLIWFDHEQVVLTPNYHVQRLFSVNKGDYYVPCTKTLNLEPGPLLPPKVGKAGLGTWQTTVEYADFKVTGADGAVIGDNFSGDLQGWTTLGGKYLIKEGVLAQTDGRAAPALSFFKTPASGSRGVITVRARKTAGSEGFLVAFGGTNENQYYWWNIGGWGNKRHGIEYLDNNDKQELARANGKIESNRWYELKVELDGDRIRCFIDGKKVHDFTEKQKSRTVGVAVAKDSASGELIIKIANPLEQSLTTEVKLTGVTQLAATEAGVVTLSGARGAVNDLQNPERVKPAISTLKVAPRFTCEMPAMSVKFIRVKID
ncbi:MAG: alpha-L-arabinofuranosidase C-terminal domain-containing protein [Kiritimatiellae bacterium]|nr:alpha-L-arabinofuranosidase C-terminal domain-containing protein [Kiritimatiellia bacterium]